MILKKDNKVSRNVAGEVLIDSGGSSKLLLTINKDLQIPNMIHKDETTGAVSQVTDRSLGRAFKPENGVVYYDYNDGFLFTQGPMLTNYNMNFDFSKAPYSIEIWFKDDISITAAFIFTIRNVSIGSDFISITKHQTTKVQMEMKVNNSTVGRSLTSSTLIKSGEWNHVYLCLGVDTKCLVLNGIQSDKVTDISLIGQSLLAKTIPSAIGGTINYGSARYKGAIKGVQIHNTAPQDILDADIGDVLFPDPSDQDPFNYYHRYKDDGIKKLYISSRYLENADVDSENKIQNIYSSVNKAVGMRLAQIHDSQKPKWTKNGLFFIASNSLSTLGVESACPKGISDFTYSLWAMNTLITSVDQLFQSDPFLAYSINGSTLVGRIYNSAGSFINITTAVTLSINEYYHYCFIKKGDTIFIFINGVLLNIYNLSIGYELQELSDSVSLNVQHNDQGFIGYMDDFLITHNAIVDPTGFSAGDKVFEPPRRGGFENYIIQYPVGGGAGFKVYL